MRYRLRLVAPAVLAATAAGTAGFLTLTAQAAPQLDRTITGPVRPAQGTTPTGPCLAVKGGVAKVGASLETASCIDKAKQRFVLKSDGTVRTVGMCVSADPATPAVTLATCDPNDARQWWELRWNGGHDVLINAKRCLSYAGAGTGSTAQPAHTTQCTNEDSTIGWFVPAQPVPDQSHGPVGVVSNDPPIVFGS
jgi:Ricin-type beta-trefoil lectin domain